MADFPSSLDALDVINTLARTLSNGNATSGTSIIVTAGDGIVGEDATSGPAGDVNIAGGDNTGGSGGDDGGDVIIAAGVANAGDGGVVSLAGGTSTSAIGGDVELTPGLGPTNDGIVNITRSGIQLTQRSAVPGPAIGATQGRIWLRDDSPNALVFTNGAGSDLLIATGATAATGEIGNIYEDLQFYVDSADRNSYPTTGTLTTDLISGSDATLSGVTFTEGCFRFDGASGSISFTKGASLHNVFDGGGTVIVIARPNNGGESNAGFLISTMNSSLNLGWKIGIRDINVRRVGIEFTQTFTSNDGVWRTFDQTSREDPEPLTAFTTNIRPWPVGSFAAIAVTYDNSSTTNDPTIYINGQPWTTTKGLQETTAPTGTRDDDTANALTIGNEPGDTRTWAGDIATVLVFDRILSSREILQVQQIFAQRYGLGLLGRPNDTASGNEHGQFVIIRGGDNNSTGGDADGGSVVIVGGDQNGTTFADAGSILIRGGHHRGGSNARGGNLTLASGEGQLGAQVQIYAGAITSGNSASADSVLIHGSDTATGLTGSPGGVQIRGGNAAESGSNRGGADVLVQGGGGDASPGGDVLIRSGGQVGANTAGSTGAITISTDRNGTGGTNTNTGHIFINTTGPGATAQSAGDITITAGSTNAVTGNDPGSVTITAGSMNRSGQSFVGGRNVTLNAGLSNGGGTAPGGSIVCNAGNYTGGSTSTGGDVTLTAGNANGSGRAGNIILTPGTNTGAGADGQVVINGELVTPAQASLSAADGSGTDGFAATLSAGAGDTGFNGGNITLSAGDEGSGGVRGSVILQTNTVEPQPATAVEFAMVIPLPASGDGNGFRIEAAGGFTTNDSGGDVTITAGATGGGTGVDGDVLLQGDAVFINEQVVSATSGGFLQAGSFDVKIEGKSATAASGNAGHSVTVQGGVGDGAGDGGDLVLAPGADGGTGTDGVIRMVNPADTALETTASWSGGNFGFLAPPGQAATDAGTGIFLTGGDGNTTGAPGQITLTGGSAGTDNTGGDVNLIGGDGAGSENGGGSVNLTGGGAADGNGGAINIDGGQGTGTGRTGGLVTIRGGLPGTNASGGTVQIQGRTGNGTGNGGSITLTAADSGAGATGAGGAITGNAGDANSTNGAGGGITWNAGDGAGSGDGGSVTLTAGADGGTGVNGAINLRTEGIDGPVSIRTTSGFVGTELEKLTTGTQQSVASGAGTADLATVGTLTADGQNMKFRIWVTAVDNAVDTNVISVVIEQTAYRASGTVNLVTVHRSDEQGNGATFLTDMSFALVVSTDDVILRATNTSSTVTYTINTSVEWERQEGGFAS